MAVRGSELLERPGPVCCAPIQAQTLQPADARSLARSFAALGDPVRLQLLSLLATSGDGAVCVCDLTGPVGKSQPTVSHHLSVLTDAGLLTRDKRGRWAWFRVVPERLALLRDALAPATATAVG